jgi:hypothetical protein
MAEWRKSLKGQEIIAEAKARYRQSAEGKAKERAYKNQYRERENELARVRSKLPDNLAKQALRQKRRRAALIPRMHPDHREKIAEIYEMAASLGVTVDHIVPLYGENVWGLHAPQNLQILTRQENSRKRDQLTESDSHA